MELPGIIREKIQANHKLESLLSTALAHYEPWLDSSNTPFFPEYTDHSLTHVQEVLRTTVDIATNPALEVMTAEDVVVLTIAVCLHDCAMHLTEDGFLSLIAEDSHWKPVQHFDSTTWRELWVDFIAEARRFDGRKLYSLFGDTEPIHRPPPSPLDWTARDRLLIGEFVRRHHARLAHEIALYGVPAVDGSPYELFNSKADNKIADLGGVVARSHGLNLRTSIDYLRDKYHVREFDGIHAVYLMVLLRIADYLQIQSGRAPSETLELRKLRSPVSQGEWSVHGCVRNITLEGEDPEAIFIDAQPEDVKIFLRAKSWLDGVQEELDKSWAVLGEVYGRFDGLNRLALRLRRVRSNLDDTRKFNQQVDYVPEKIAFEAANPDLLKLLVRPLYDDDPAIGVRELIQNAVDAVWELEDLIEQRPELKDIERRQQKADVVITVEVDDDENPQKLTVSDRGVGMNLDVIKNYFLKAGASFRNSDAWKRQHEEEDGHSRVLRSGRFGIGVLAAFLIGDKISITTRHAESPRNDGFGFSAQLDEDVLHVKSVQCPVGAAITIHISKEDRVRARRLLGYRHYAHQDIDDLANLDGFASYALSKPSLLLVLQPDETELQVKETLPSLRWSQEIGQVAKVYSTG